MEWYSSNLIRRHQHRFRPFFSRKTACQKYFSNPFPKKRSDCESQKIRIWIWSEESTLSVDFMNSWSVFGYTQKHSKSVFGFGNPYLDFLEKKHPNIHVSSNGISKKSNCWLCRALTNVATESAVVSWKQVTWTCTSRPIGFQSAGFPGTYSM